MAWRPIVVGVDSSAAGMTAAEAGWALAERVGTACVLVHAVREIPGGTGGAPGTVDVGAIAREVMSISREELARGLTGRVPPSLIQALELRAGPAALVLRDAVQAHGADLLVLGAKHHSQVARWLGGSTAKNALRALDVSVLVAMGSARWGRILAAVDLSEAAFPTLAAAERLASQMAAKLRVLHAIEPLPYTVEGPVLVDLEALAAQAEQAFRKDIWSRVTYGTAEPVVRRTGALLAIEQEASEWRADLVVVGAHGRSRVERIFLGSVSEGVVNALPASVLVVRGAGPGAG